MPAPYAAAVLDLERPGSLTLHLGEHALTGVWDGTHVSITRLHAGETTSTHRSRRHGACALPPDAAGADPDRHPPHRRSPRRRAPGWPARDSTSPTSPTSSTPTTRACSPSLRVEATGAFTAGSLRPARPARHPARHHARRHPGARRLAAAAERHVGRTRLLRHRPHLRLGARSRLPRARAPQRPLLPPTRQAAGCTATTPPTSSATATRGWSRPARGATSGSSDPERSVRATLARTVGRRADAAAHVLDTDRAPAADRRLHLRRGLGPAPRAHRRGVAGRLRQRAEVLQVPPGAGERTLAGPADACAALPSIGAPPRAPRCCASATTGECWPATAATAGAGQGRAIRSST